MSPAKNGAWIALAWLVSITGAAADTFPVSGTVRFETGLHRLGSINLNQTFGATVDWGDGTSLQPGLLDCPLVGACDIFGTHRYTTTGTFTITIHYRTPVLLLAETETTTATISPVGDFVILSIGDSVASGEGSPAVRFQGYWDDPGSNYDYPDGHPDGRTCHRASGAGPALTARTVGQTNPMTFVHAACSGDDVGQAINQLRSARGRLPRIDVLLISTGANEVAGGFGNLLERCILEINDPCSKDQVFADQIAQDIAELDAQYEGLAASIACLTPDDAANCSHMVQPVPPLVLMTEYFDPTHDGEGGFPEGVENIPCTGGVVSAAEWRFLYDHMVVPLNAQVRQSAPQNPDFPRYTRWEPVTGIQEAFLTHGYCANPGPGGFFGESWIVKLPDSLLVQLDAMGTGHPDRLGQAAYRDYTYARLRALNPPVTTASATSEGLPYAFGTWTPNDVEVTLDATNPIRESGIGTTYYAVDDPDCLPDLDPDASCSIYTGPFTIDTSGQHTVTFFSTNDFEGREPPKQVEVWIDKDPPVMTCSADPSFLWPPNGHLRQVETSVDAVDAVFGPMPFVLVDATTSEGNPAADIKDFDIGEPDTEGRLRARRAGFGPGRLYVLTYESADPLGNVGRCEIPILVPHDQRPPGHERNVPPRVGRTRAPR